MMRLTVLGCSPACQNPGGACSGYLIEQDGTAVLLDCGSGVFGRLQQYLKPEQLQAVVVSHMHADHFLDLIQYRYYLYFANMVRPLQQRPALFLPPGGHAKLLAVSLLQDPSETFFSALFDTHEYDPSVPLHVGALTVDFVPVRHIPHTYGMRVRGDAVLAYSSDSGLCEGLGDVARSSDLFLSECANTDQSEYPFHLTPRQAGSIASSSGSKQLLLTHRWWVHGHDVALGEAAETYHGPMRMAQEGMQLELS